jgi:hypothetical protein
MKNYNDIIEIIEYNEFIIMKEYVALDDWE